ncbi:MAG: endonuclease/exonuclease/phosphatase family protein [Pseudomonadota bacterium]
MDADFVGLQELFHEEALQAVVDRYHQLLAERDSESVAARKAYAHVWHLPNLNSSPDDPGPGLALLSRRPILEQHAVQDLSDDPISADDVGGLDYRLTRLSRPLMIAKVTLIDGVEAWLFNAHLKSKRPIYPEGSEAEEEQNAMFLERTTGSFRSLVLRAGEALAMRREVLRRITGSSDPLILLGDLNDAGDAVSTEMIAGEVPYRSWNIDLKKVYWDVELYSAARIHLRRSEGVEFFSHIYNGHYGMIDHIFVSQEFYFRNGKRIGDVSFVRCFNDHLTDASVSGAPGLGSASDHGQLVARMFINVQDDDG